MLLSAPADSGAEGEPPGPGDPSGGPSQSPDLEPPVISNFEGDGDDGFWVFTGQVTDDKAVEGLVVEFGGILDGESAVVNSEGWFLITVYIPPDVQGFVSATTTDSDGLDSNTVYHSVNF